MPSPRAFLPFAPILSSFKVHDPSCTRLSCVLHRHNSQAAPPIPRIKTPIAPSPHVSYLSHLIDSPPPRLADVAAPISPTTRFRTNHRPTFPKKLQPRPAPNQGPALHSDQPNHARRCTRREHAQDVKRISGIAKGYRRSRMAGGMLLPGCDRQVAKMS